eukprot:TRINITY_DN1209_c0_g1_i3.p1 TRINITY_DN1209_c0_g1~~TRINITY_DN1209_c0_g1_i3.p1  ORF type:complete len:226 (+),score=6.95 TRINITY_DN1209_c0_g1_i3:288-965(+)
MLRVLQFIESNDLKGVDGYLKKHHGLVKKLNLFTGLKTRCNFDMLKYLYNLHPIAFHLIEALVIGVRHTPIDREFTLFELLWKLGAVHVCRRFSVENILEADISFISEACDSGDLSIITMLLVLGLPPILISEHKNPKVSELSSIFSEKRHFPLKYFQFLPVWMKRPFQEFYVISCLATLKLTRDSLNEILNRLVFDESEHFSDRHVFPILCPKRNTITIPISFK